MFIWLYVLLYVPWNIQGYIYVCFKHPDVFLFSNLFRGPAVVFGLTLVFRTYVLMFWKHQFSSDHWSMPSWAWLVLWWIMSVWGNCYLLLLFFVVSLHVSGDCCHYCCNYDGVFKGFSVITPVTMYPIRAHLQLWLSRMWFCCHCWCHGTKGVVLALSLCCSTCLSPRQLTGIYQLCHGSSTDKFLFQGWASNQFSKYVGVSYGVSFQFSSSTVDAIFSYEGLTQNVVSGCSPVAFSRGALCFSISYPPAIPAIWWGL